jgi:hypothetical protein
LPHVTCPSCGGWELDTGLVVAPVAGPVGTPPAVARRSAPLWRPRPPDTTPLNRGQAHKPKGNAPKRKRGRPEGSATRDDDLKLWRDWEAAHRQTKCTKTEFVLNRGLDPVEGMAALERGRKAASEKAPKDSGNKSA